VGLEAPVVATALSEIRFCGNGPNGAVATYIGPVLAADHGTDMTFGAAGCDGKDNTTEATADAVWTEGVAFKPVAMTCWSTCGTDDVMSVQLREDASDVTGLACDLTLNGAAAQCSDRLATPETVAAGSTLAIKVVNSTDDDCSSGSVECRVFVTY